MDKIILVKDEQTATELLTKGCKLLNEQDGIYTLVDYSKKINFIILIIQ